MNDLPDLSLMSASMREHYEKTAALAAGSPHVYGSWKAEAFIQEVQKAVRTVKWFRGRIKQGYGGHEDGVCYVAWLNSCPLTVIEKPRELRKYREEGQPIFGYSFSFTVGGHFSGSSDTLAGAVQEAMLGALRSGGRASSDSKWLNRKGGKAEFFAFHEADTERDAPLSLADFMTPEFMARVPVTEGPYAEPASSPRP